MFEFHRCEVVHWDYWQRCKIPLDSRIITIIGPNGSGKTTLLDALRTLLALECSRGRDYKRYVRHSGSGFAWLRVVVGNARDASGRLPFFPITEGIVTLTCRIQKKGGEWERQYCIEPGDITIERLEQTADWLGVRDYRVRLEAAGLSHAIKQVLALQQGDTDKLCEYSPRDLLVLVFSVFGNQEVLDNYQRAKTEQQETRRELGSLETDLSALGIRLQEAAAQVNSYQQWRRLKDERATLEAEWLPRVELVELIEAVRGGAKQLRGRRRELIEKGRALERLQSEQTQLENAIVQAQEELNEHAAIRENAERAFTKARDKARDLERLIQERTHLETLARRQGEGIDAAALAREIEAARQQLASAQNRRTETEQQLSQLDTQLAAWCSGTRLDPDFLGDLRAAFNEAGVNHEMLTEIIEVTDPAWQGAVEAVLAPYRHVVLLKQPADRTHAWQIGERLRYRHFIVPDCAAPPIVRTGSLLEAVKFKASPPLWLARLLNDIRKVASVNEGSGLAEHQAWITAESYHRERRGGRYIGVTPKDYYFGEVARQRRIEAAQDEREALLVALTELSREIRRLGVDIAERQALLSGIDAAQALVARAPEFDEADARLPAMQEDARQAGEQVAAHQAAENTAQEHFHKLDKRHDLITYQVNTAEAELAKLRPDFDRQRADQVGRIQVYRENRRNMPDSWYRGKALEEVKKKFASVNEVGREMERLDKRLTDSDWVTDKWVLAKRDKLRDDHQRLEATLDERRRQNERAMQLTNEARAAYINVLRATVRRYAHNLRALGELAGVRVEVESPYLENDDLVLTQAGLEVKFNFDEKGFIGLDDGEASGGQQVMKSLILLVGLMMDERRSGGFVFIDEPFAHLDIFNIDKVGAFLAATQAQYIVTTPNTHNVNVFSPSDLILVTSKRRAPERWAPLIAYQRRGVRHDSAKTDVGSDQSLVSA